MDSHKKSFSNNPLNLAIDFKNADIKPDIPIVPRFPRKPKQIHVKQEPCSIIPGSSDFGQNKTVCYPPPHF